MGHQASKTSSKHSQDDFPKKQRPIPKRESQCGLFSNIPKELFFEIMKYVSDTDLLHVSQTCCTFYSRLSDANFWIELASQKKKAVLVFDNNSFKHAKEQYFSLVDVARKSYFSSAREKIKVITSGNTRVGKTWLISALNDSAITQTEYQPTPTMFSKRLELKVPEYDNKILGRILEYTVPHEYRHVYFQPYQNEQPHVILLVYSVMDRQSFIDLRYWYEDAVKLAPLAKKIVVATHIDVSQPHQVTEEEGRDWANVRGLAFLQVSSVDHRGVEELKKFITSVLKISGPQTSQPDLIPRRENPDYLPI